MIIKNVLDFEGLSYFTEKIKTFVTSITSKLEANKLDKTTVATSSTLGLVKSGTDITVDTSGNVSVNDNSHKHTVSNISDLTANATELNYVDGVTSNIQTQLNSKQPNITGGATTITSSNLTDSRALISNSSGKVAVSDVTSTELGYLGGVTSSIQTQLDTKAPLASPTLTGTPKAPTATAGTNSTQIATTAFVRTAVSNLVNSAPETLDTLGEIADALKDNADIVDVLNESITTKANASDLTSHTSNTTVHITSTERSNWNDANSKKHTHSNKTILDNTTASYTTEEKEKLSGIEEGAETTAATISGSNPTVTNSANAPLIYGKIKGYTEQKTLSGKNLLKITNTTETTNGITFTVNEDGNITINGTATADTNFDVTHIANITGNGNIKIKLFQLNGSYTGTVEHLAFTSDWGHSFLVPIGEEGFLNTDITYSIFRIKVSSGTVCNNLKVGFMVAEDVSEYEPFCGGIASPNPDYPQDIKGLGDSGTIEVKTCGKNRLKITNTTQTNDGITFTVNEDGTITINGTATADTNFNVTLIANITGNGNIKRKLFQLNGSYTGTVEHLAFTSDWGHAFSVPIGEEGFLNTDVTYSIFRIKVSNGTVCNNLKVGFMVAEDVSDYEPYTETTATIPIDTLYEGDYLEVYADGSGKIHRENGIYTATDSSGWHAELTVTNVTRIRNNTALAKKAKGSSEAWRKSVGFCNQLIVGSPQDTWDGVLDNCFGIDTGGFLYVYINSISTVSEFNTLLTENPMIFVYKLAEPIEEPLTAEQVEQFKQLYSFDNTTHFFCDGEITARYYVNTDSGDTVGKLQEQVNENLSLLEYGEDSGNKNLAQSVTVFSLPNAFYAALNAKIPSVKIGKTYTISFKGAYEHKIYANEDLFTVAEHIVCNGHRQSVTLTAKANGTDDSLIFKNDNGNTVIPYFSEVMIEEGNKATAYVPFIPSIKMLAEDTEKINNDLLSLNKTITETYTTNTDFSKIVGGTVSSAGLTNIEYTIPTEISSAGLGTQSNNSGTLVDALKTSTSKITEFFGTLYDEISQVEEDNTILDFSNNDVTGSLNVFRHKLSENTYLLNVAVTITNITETLSGNGPSVDLTLQDIGFANNIVTANESQCLLASYYPLIVNGNSYCLGGGMASTEADTKGFYLRFLPHKNTKGSINATTNTSFLSGTMVVHTKQLSS